MTREEALWKVWGYFVDGGAPQGADEETCMYWEPDTQRMCAVGVLLGPEIGEKLWAAGYAGCTIREATRIPEVQDALGELSDDDNFLISLQRFHDSANPWDFASDFEQKLRLLAKNYELRVPE